MGLDSKTNEFNETIFYKNDSELTYQIKALEKLNSEYPNNENIKNELKKCKASIKNESRIESKLMDSKIEMVSFSRKQKKMKESYWKKSNHQLKLQKNTKIY